MSKIILFLTFVILLIGGENNQEFKTKVLKQRIIIDPKFKATFVCENVKEFSTKMFYDLKNGEELIRFYKNICNDNPQKKLLWFEGEYRFSKKSLELYKSIQNSYFHGLIPSNYHDEKIVGFIIKL